MRMQNVKKAINLLEEITNKRVVLKEDMFDDFLSKGKQPKVVRDVIEKLKLWSTQERIPEREWSKFQTVSYKLSPKAQLVQIYPLIQPGDFPLYEKQQVEIQKLFKKYGGDSINSIWQKMSKTEQANWQKVLDETESEGWAQNQVARKQEYGKEINGTFVPYKIYKQLEKGGMLPSDDYGLDVRNESKLTEKVAKLEQGLKLIKSIPAVVKIYQQNIAQIEKYIPIAQEVAKLQSKVESGKEQKAREKKQQIKGSVNPVIYKEIEIIAEDFRKIIEENQFMYYAGKKTAFLKAVEETGSNDLYVIWPEKLIPGRWRSIDANEGNRRKWDAVLDYIPEGGLRYSNKNSKKMQAKSDEALFKMAFDESTQEAQSFLFKMSDKLGGMFKDIDVKLEIVKLDDRNMRSNQLLFKINGGDSQFILQNQITHNYSHLGTFFYRYPTTFHNAIIKGQKLKLPDEVSVKQALNLAYGKV